MQSDLKPSMRYELKPDSVAGSPVHVAFLKAMLASIRSYDLIQEKRSLSP